MIDQTQINKARQVNLLELIGQDTSLKRVSHIRGGEYAGACPFCGGTDRLRVQPEQGQWWCRQCTGSQTDKWQDAITYVKLRDRVEFMEAVRRLAGNQVSQSFKPAHVQVQAKKEQTISSSDQWQKRAREWMLECEHHLWKEEGAKARAWLQGEHRHLTEETLLTWHIGFNPVDQWDAPEQWGLDGKKILLPRGILMPCLIEEKIWYLKIRLAAGDHKYTQVRGSQPALFGANTLGHHDYAVFAEGEFDAMLTWQCLQHATNTDLHQIGVATLGSATTSFDIDLWARYLLPVARFLVCYDTDEAGQKGLTKWESLSARTRRVQVPKVKPTDKDLTDFHRSGGRILDLITYEMMKDRYQQGQTQEIGQTKDDTGNERIRLQTLDKTWNDLFDQLDLLQAQGKQDTPEFDRWFAQWEEVDREYRELYDQIEYQ
jgi:hypothetical protein